MSGVGQLDRTPLEGALWIVNPIAGRSGSNPVEQRLRAELPDALVHRTTRAGEAGEVAREAVAAGRHTVVVVSGDGTLSDVANAVLEAPAPPDFTLGFVSAGTCNDFCRGRPVSERLGDLLDRGRARRVDVGRVTYTTDAGERSRYFVVNCTIGLISTIGERFVQKNPLNLALKRISVDLAEVVYGLDTIARWRPAQLTLRVDGERIETGATNVAILKVPYFAGGLRFDSSVALDDGRLEAVVIDALSRPRTLALMLEAFARRRLRRRETIRSWLAGEIAVEASRALPLEVDGEIVGRTPARFTVLPGRLLTVT